MFGFSTGGGEVARYIGRHGTKRVKKAGLVSAVPPLMLKTDANPGGLPIDVFDGIRAGLLANRAQLFKDIPSGPFFGYNRPGAKPSQGVIDAWWLQGMMGGHKNTYDSIKAFSETDFTEDLKKFDVPTIIIHGDDDQVVPIDAAARVPAGAVPVPVGIGAVTRGPTLVAVLGVLFTGALMVRRVRGALLLGILGTAAAGVAFEDWPPVLE